MSGDIIITGSGSQAIQHNGITLSLEGNVHINLSTKNVGVFEAFYNSAKVYKILNHLLFIRKLLFFFQAITIDQLFNGDIKSWKASTR